MISNTEFLAASLEKVYQQEVTYAGKQYYLRVIKGKLSDSNAHAIVIPVGLGLTQLNGMDITLKTGEQEKYDNRKGITGTQKKKIQKLKAGHSVTTVGGQFEFKKIIRARCFSGQDAAKNEDYLRDGLKSSLTHLRGEKEITMLAIPAQLGEKTELSGQKVAMILIKTTLQYLEKNGAKTFLKQIHFQIPDEKMSSIYEKTLMDLIEADPKKSKDIHLQEEKKAPKEDIKSEAPLSKKLALPKGLKELECATVTFGGREFTLRVVKGDVTIETTGAIVNAANSLLIHGAGLARAIASKAGEQGCNKSLSSLQVECRKWRDKHDQLPVGEAMSTAAGFMPSKRVIHTVGPMGRKDKEKNDAQLRQAAISSLKECDRLKLASIAIPAVSSGLFGFPKDKCAEVIINATLDYLNAEADQTHIQEVHFTNIDEETCIYFVQGFKEHVSNKIAKKVSLGSGGYSTEEKKSYRDLERVSIPFKKYGGGPVKEKTGGGKGGKGGVTYVKKGGK